RVHLAYGGAVILPRGRHPAGAVAVDSRRSFQIPRCIGGYGPPNVRRAPPALRFDLERRKRSLVLKQEQAVAEFPLKAKRYPTIAPALPWFEGDHRRHGAPPGRTTRRTMLVGPSGRERSI